MKTLHPSIIILLTAGLLAFATNSVYAPCLVGITDCGPPPGVTVSASTDSQFYEKNDTINIQGQVYVQNYSRPIHIQVINPDNVTIQNIDTPVTNGKFGLKIGANFDTTGVYQIVTCVQSWCDRSYFKFISEPYKLTVNGQDFFIQYKSFADLVGMEADINNNALRIHVTNATSQGLQFVIELPRALIDSTQYGKDAIFTVLYGVQQPDKYMQPASFTEIANNNLSRTLAIDIPYEPVPNASGTWDFKISSVETTPRPSVFVESPLKQFKSGIAANDIKCDNGSSLVIKAEDGSPACVKPQTAQKLVERGWGWAMQAIDSLKPLLLNRIMGLENDTGVVTFGNQTYYFETPNYTKTVYVNPVQISFHDVVFTLFPSGFRGGLPSNGCGGQYYWTDAKFSDGISELLHIFPITSLSQQCLTLPEPIYFSNHTNSQAGLTFYDGKMKLLVSVDNQVFQKENTMPTSFEPCDTSYPQSNAGIAVMYMPANSTGELCVEYSNPNPPRSADVRIFEAQHLSEDTKDIQVLPSQDNIPQGNSTIVYTLKTSKVGFYGLTLFCYGTPLAVGYDNQSRIVANDFPWLGQTFYCPMQTYTFHISGLSGIGVKYIPYP